VDDPNKRHHIFGNPNHNLDALVEQYGSGEAAGRAIEDAVNEAYRDGKIIVDGLGVYKQAFDVGGYSVIVRGRIFNGLVRIGSAWRQPETNIHFIGRYQPPKYAAPKYLRSYWQNTAQDLLIRPLDVEDHDA
jgi:hypothetical protein